MKENIDKIEFLDGFTVYKVNRCRTIYYSFRLFLTLVVLSASLISCGPSTRDHLNGNKNLPTNEATKETKGSGGGGTGDGGGGQGISCSSEVSDPKIKGRLLVRDIYEAITNHGRTMKSLRSASEDSNKISPEAFKILVESIKYYFGPASKNLDFANEKFWMEFEKRISFINDTTPLHYSQDANSPISLPSGCKIVQIAFWHESSGPTDEGTLYVDQKHWGNLDQFNKVALLAHEFFFKQARQAGHKNSDFVRNQVGRLLSIEGLEPIFKEWVPSKDSRVSDILPAYMKGFKYCTGKSDEDPSASLQLYQYRGKDGLQHFAIPFLKSNSINISLLQGNFLNLNLNKGYFLSKAIDFWIVGRDMIESCVDECLTRKFADHDDEQIWRKLWYGDDLLLTSPVSYYDEMKHNLTLNKSLMLWPNTEATLWSALINSNSQIVEIFLRNPGYGLKQSYDYKLKPSEELMKLIYSKLSADLNQFFYQRLERSELFKKVESSSTEKKNQHLEQHKINLANAISILNNELQDALNSGVYPEGFPKWNAALTKVIKFIDDFQPTPFEVKPLFLVDTTFLAKLLPNQLYKIKNNVHEVTDFVHNFFELDDLILERPHIPEFGSGILQLRQSNINLDFKLSCVDYKTLYSKSTQKKVDIKANKQINTDMEILLEDGSGDDEIDQEDLQKEKEILNSIASIKSLGEMLNIVDSYNNTCQKRGNISGFNCNDLAMLSNDLNNEKKLSIGECYFEKPRTSNWVKNLFRCNILKFESAKNRYQLVLTAPRSVNSSEETEKVFFIRRIPYEVEKVVKPKEISDEIENPNETIFNGTE